MAVYLNMKFINYFFFQMSLRQIQAKVKEKLWTDTKAHRAPKAIARPSLFAAQHFRRRSQRAWVKNSHHCWDPDLTVGLLFHP